MKKKKKYGGNPQSKVSPAEAKQYAKRRRAEGAFYETIRDELSELGYLSAKGPLSVGGAWNLVHGAGTYAKKRRAQRAKLAKVHKLPPPPKRDDEPTPKKPKGKTDLMPALRAVLESERIPAEVRVATALILMDTLA